MHCWCWPRAPAAPMVELAWWPAAANWLPPWQEQRSLRGSTAAVPLDPMPRLGRKTRYSPLGRRRSMGCRSCLVAGALAAASAVAATGNRRHSPRRWPVSPWEPQRAGQSWKGLLRRRPSRWSGRRRRQSRQPPVVASDERFRRQWTVFEEAPDLRPTSSRSDWLGERR